MNRASSIFVAFTVVITAILFIGIVLVTFVPTEKINSFSNKYVAFAEQRLHRDLLISNNQLEFVAGRFSRESIIVFRVLDTDIPIDKFRKVDSGKQKFDCANRVSEIFDACEINAKTSLRDKFFVSYGNDYSAIFLQSESNDYLIYLGMQ